MRILKNNRRKNRLIKQLRDRNTELTTRFSEFSKITLESLDNSRNHAGYLHTLNDKLSEEVESLMEYKAKYYSLIKNL